MCVCVCVCVCVYVCVCVRACVRTLAIMTGDLTSYTGTDNDASADLRVNNKYRLLELVGFVLSQVQ